MKKGLVVMLGLLMVVFLYGCNKGQQLSNPVVDENNNPSDVVDLNGGSVEVDNTELGNLEAGNVELDNNAEEVTQKTSLTLADLDEIEELSFPLSYSYERYGREDNEPYDSGRYIYPDGDNHGYLLPIYENVVSREVVESESDGGWIYTVVNVVLEDESERSIVYMNDPVTLHYVAATVTDEEGSTLYSFNY